MTHGGSTARSQMVRCPEHGFYYDAQRAAGCNKCLEESAPSPAPYGGETVQSGGSGRRFPVMPILWLVFLGGIGWGGYRFVGSMAEDGGEAYQEVVAVESRIDPNLVRSELEAVEALVYTTSPDIGQGSRVQRATMVLYRSVMLRAGSLVGAHHGNKIVGFGNAASAYEDVGFQGANIQQIQAQWEAMLADVFHEAPWYRSAGS